MGNTILRKNMATRLKSENQNNSRLASKKIEIFIYYSCVLVALFWGGNVFSEDKKFMREIFKSLYVDKKNIASSFLVEPNKKKDFYSPNKASDLKLNSAWVVNKNQGIGEFLYIKFYGSKFECDNIKGKVLSGQLEIVNGYAENEKLFKANNRVKKVTLDIYETIGSPAIDQEYYFDEDPIKNSSFEFELKDSILPQKINFTTHSKVKPKNIEKSNILFFIAKLTIMEIYPGEKHKDTCISEASITFIDN